jgi:6-phosphogluconolactonase (cycloisomerase 2 family)
MNPSQHPNAEAHSAVFERTCVGHLYMQTNEQENAIVHYRRMHDGSLEEAGRTATGGKGSGVFKPVSGQSSAPNAFEGAGSVILTPDRRHIFTTNGGDNSVSSFAVESEGDLRLIRVEQTGNEVSGESGTVKSLAYSRSHRALYALHAFGPDHIRVFSVSDDGALSLRAERYSVNVGTRTDRIPTQAVLSPDGKFLLIDILFDARPVSSLDGVTTLVVANAPDPDGLVAFPVTASGALGKPLFQDAGGAGPFYIAFLNGSSGTFLNGTAVGDGLVMSRIDGVGHVSVDELVPISTGAGKPSELCWLAITPDNRLVFATNFGYGNISSYWIVDGKLAIAKDPACEAVPGDGTFRAVNGLVSSGPSDNWLSPDGKHLYQIYGNASVLVGYAVHDDGSLSEHTRMTIPYNSPQGLAGL